MDPSALLPRRSATNPTFPIKLWCLINTPQITAITWNSSGDGVLIDQALMESQVLSPTTEILKKLSQFKGIKFLSFVRQLHHYGFRKVQPVHGSYPGVHHYYHPRFKKNHPELLEGVRRQGREHKRARAHPYKRTPAHRNGQDLHRGNLHQWPNQPFPVAPNQFPVPAQPLYMPGMPPGLAYNTGGHPGVMHHPYTNGIPNVLQYGVPVANQYNPGCYMPAVWWNQQVPVNPFPCGPIGFYQPTNLGVQPTGVPAGGPSQRVSSVPDHLNVPTGPTEDSPQAVIEDPFTELQEMLLLVCILENRAQANAFQSAAVRHGLPVQP